MNKTLLKKIIREELQRECGMAPSLPPVAVTAPLSKDVPLPSQGVMEPTPEMNISDEDLAGMGPSEAFGFAWTTAVEQLRAEFPEAAARLESLSGGPTPEEIGGS